jgi:hypothetical protein
LFRDVAAPVSITTQTEVSRMMDIASSPAYSLNRNVALVLHDEMGRLIDLEHGRFYALDAIGTRMLTLALRCGRAETVADIAAAYGVPEEQVQGDWETFFGNLRRKQLVVARAAGGCRLKPPGAITLWLLLSWAWLCLRVLGWMHTIRLWQRDRRPLSPALGPAEEAAVGRVDQAVRQAAAHHLLNAQCKERALVSWHLLRNRFGLPAELVVGVMPYPFQAHAWVECGRLTVTDESGRCEMYTAVARFA